MWNDGTNGKRNTSLGFDGTNDYADLNNSFSYASGSPFSVSTWFKSASFSGDQTLVGSNIVNDGGLTVLTSSVIWIVADSGGGCAYGINTLSTNTWYHLAVTKSSGNSITLYINGNSEGSCSQGSSTNTFRLLGTDRTTFNSPLNGQLDDVQIFNYALTAQQVKTVMNQGAVSFVPITGSP